MYGKSRIRQWFTDEGLFYESDRTIKYYSNILGREVWGQKLDEGKADYYVKVNVPIDRLERMPSNSREVYKYDGPIDLKEFGGRVYKVITSVL